MRLTDDPNFQRLPGSKRTFLGTSQYWLGPDHLLEVEVVGVVERYRRYDLRDLVALTIRRKPNVLWPIVSGVSALVSFFLGWATRDEMFYFPVSFGVLTLGLIALTLFLAFSSQCETHLTTTVQTRKLTSIWSLKGAHQFRDALLAGIAARGVQNRTNPENLGSVTTLVSSESATNSTDSSQPSA